MSSGVIYHPRGDLVSTDCTYLGAILLFIEVSYWWYYSYRRGL